MGDNNLRSDSVARIQELMQRAGLNETELQESFVRGSGPGGQKVNKTASCVFLKHAPSGLQVKCQATRSRETNRWLARRELAERILERVRGEATARQQEDERVRRQKRRKSRRQRARMLADKRIHSAKKAGRRTVGGADEG